MKLRLPIILVLLVQFFAAPFGLCRTIPHAESNAASVGLQADHHNLDDSPFGGLAEFWAIPHGHEHEDADHTHVHTRVAPGEPRIRPLTPEFFMPVAHLWHEASLLPQGIEPCAAHWNEFGAHVPATLPFAGRTCKFLF